MMPRTKITMFAPQFSKSFGYSPYNATRKVLAVLLLTAVAMATDAQEKHHQRVLKALDEMSTKPRLPKLERDESLNSFSSETAQPTQCENYTAAHAMIREFMKSDTQGPLDHCYHCKRKFGKECKRWMDGLTFLCDTCLVKCRKCREMGFSRSGALGKETKLFPHPEDLEGPREYCRRPGKGCYYIVCNKYHTDLGYRPLYLLNKNGEYERRPQRRRRKRRQQQPLF